MDIEFLTTEQVIEIQSSTLPNSGEPNMDRLEGALNRIHALHYYEECDDIFVLAAQYLIAIAKAHAFNDANKRTAFQAASIFLMMNGSELGTSFRLVKLTIMAAMDNADLREVAFSLMLLSNYENHLMEGYPEEYL
ncbi:death-on-curing family protein [Serratia ficaria]|uniref:type II toxin-antitoxin system death-on-curing family toxin n=1 Tax=Serratia ficaria TaxID=61651 RepID=UPI0021826DE3|nr:type II toxin-antitoxin system death-on-curing family toxin [Serratia ficaria]CAI2532372.1 death-on-curing family protein [Serratia ficaria]